MLVDRKNLIALWAAILVLGSHSYAQASLPNDSLQTESQAYPLTGKVVNSVTGKGIPRVLVRLPEIQRAALTDSEGNFSFANVPAGKVAIAATKPGYFHADQPLVPGQFYTFNDLPYESQAGPEMAGLPLRLLPEAQIFGTIRGNNGDPLPRVNVSVLMLEGKQLRAVRGDAVTDGDGKFSVSRLAPGRYYLRARPATPVLQAKAATTEEAYPDEIYFPASDAAGAAPLDLVAGQAREANLNLKLIQVKKRNLPSPPEAQPEQIPSIEPGHFQITGVLVDALRGRPISQARVAISDASDPYGFLAVIKTGADGRFSFPALGEGNYVLAAEREGYGFDFYNMYGFHTTGLIVGPGLDPGSLVFRFSACGRLSGRITDEAGEAVHKAHVLLYRTGTGNGFTPSREADSDEQGIYRFETLFPGRYLIAVMASPWYAQRPAAPQPAQKHFDSYFFNGPQTLGTYIENQDSSPLDLTYPITFYPGTTEANAAVPITVQGGEQFVANVTLKPVPALHVLLSTGEASDTEEQHKVKSAQIQVRLLNARPLDVPVETRILPSGRIDITGITPGHYLVKLYRLHDNYVMPTQSGEMDVSSSGESAIEHETQSVPVTVNVQFEGTATSPDPDDQYLILSEDDLAKLYTIPVPAQGTFDFRELIEAGTYHFSVNSKLSHFIKAVSASGATVIGDTVKIDGSGPVNLNLTVAFDPATVTGVALRNGKPFASAPILLAPLAHADPVRSASLFKYDQSNSDGSFALEGVAPGKYVLMAIENGSDLNWTDPSVLRPYLSRGVVLQVEENGKYDVKLPVQ